MNKHKKIINLLITLLILCSCFTVYTLLGKHNAAAPVFLFMNDKMVRYASEDTLSRPAFWDNYPYYVLISNGESIHLLHYLNTDTTTQDYTKLKAYLRQPIKLFYRFDYLQDNDSVYKATFTSIANYRRDIVILTDTQSNKYLPKFIDTSSKVNMIFTIEDHLPIYLEKPHLSYFFGVSKDDKVKDIFVPRKEIPEITDKYLIKYLSDSIIVTVSKQIF